MRTSEIQVLPESIFLIFRRRFLDVIDNQNLNRPLFAHQVKARLLPRPSLILRATALSCRLRFSSRTRLQFRADYVLSSRRFSLVFPRFDLICAQAGLPGFLHSGGLSHPLNQLLPDIQFGDIRTAAGQSGIDEFFAKQLVCREPEKHLEFRHRESQSNECQSGSPCHSKIRHSPDREACGKDAARRVTCHKRQRCRRLRGRQLGD